MLIRTGSLLILALFSFAAPATVAHADSSACPGGASGFVLWNVDAAPYQADNHVDQAGNANGWVCAKPMPNYFVSNGQEYQVQNFIDDRG